ncbi:hypothetical protein D3C76_1416670 [compost metagenome]
MRSRLFQNVANGQPKAHAHHDFRTQYGKHRNRMLSPISLKSEFAEKNEDEHAQHVNHQVAEYFAGENLAFADRRRREPRAGPLPNLP